MTKTGYDPFHNEATAHADRLSAAREGVVKALGAAIDSHAHHACNCDPCIAARAALKEYQEASKQSYAVKCDDCKHEIRRTNNIRESYAGGQCDDCKDTLT